MKAPVCSRLWQVEAARDGRLSGKDLEVALRHRATCSECAAAERELTALGQQVASLPALTRDALTTRRARQRLIAALNDVLLEPARASRVGRAALGVGLAAAFAVAALLFVGRHPARVESPARIASIIDVEAQPDARWSEHVEAALDRIDLMAGAASFRVRAHPNRRVLIRLPDGEIEDLGTVFDVRVKAERTEHVAVSEGRVSVRLRGQPEFNLNAGQSWDFAGPVGAQPSGSASAVAVSHAAAGEAAPRAAPSGDLVRSHADRVLAVRSSVSEHEQGAGAKAAPSSDPQSGKAEDDAYLRIVGLLRQAQYAQARAEAKSYLLRFPNGFRRVEVLNIATQAADDTDADSNSR